MSALERYYQARYSRFKDLLTWRQHVLLLLKAVRKVLPDADMYVFGSALRDELTANSDVDVLVVSEMIRGAERHRIAVAIEEEMENPSIFEMHLVNRDEMNWYLKHAGKLVSAEEITPEKRDELNDSQ